MSQPLVSVVTPFHNTARYLAQCIESVLTQTFSNFEYILVDNCSTDGSGEIAESYARRDPRIRFLRRPELLSQVQNYNGALASISAASQYCKIVQADDFIFPECLRLMVLAFEQSESIGLVSAYDLKGNVVRGSGFPYRSSPIPGRELARMYLGTGLFIFGSPTTVMYRSVLVRSQPYFYDESLLHEDTEKCLEILQQWDFGFVFQVLSFLRVDGESISGAFRKFQPHALDYYINVNRYARVFFDQHEASVLTKQARRYYYRALAHEALRLPGTAFWQYHRDGLKTIGQTLNRLGLGVEIGREFSRRAANPGSTIAAALRLFRRKTGRTLGSAPSRVPQSSEEGQEHLARI